MGKGAYLKRILAKMSIKPKVKKELEGTTPPSVFIGSAHYPYVYAGPMLTEAEESALFDYPEKWVEIPQQKIIEFRMNLIRGKRRVKVDRIDRYVELLQEAVLSAREVDSEAQFKNISGALRIEDESAYGPSGTLERWEIAPARWEHNLEKVFYDEQKAGEAIVELYSRGVPLSKIQKALSVGAMGVKRKLVPTRWAITAVDSIIGEHLFSEARYSEGLEEYLLYQFENHNNHFAIILTPPPWQYEWIEAFIEVAGERTAIFSDFEEGKGKKEYSCVGGCYYSCKLAILEHMKKNKFFGGAFVLREARKGYVPLGVFTVRENMRAALKERPKRFPNLKEALREAAKSLQLPLTTFLNHSRLLAKALRTQQTTLALFR